MGQMKRLQFPTAGGGTHSIIPPMLELSRTIRFCLNDDAADSPDQDNTFAAWPPMRGLGRYYQITIRCQGEPDPTTGYFMNIKFIDTAVRNHAIPHLARVLRDSANSYEIPLGRITQEVLDRIQPALGHTVCELRLDLTPYHCLTVRSADMSRMLIHEQFEFAAAHRLHVPAMSDEENLSTFGKCNNPSGHGHNYRVEVVVSALVDDAGHVLPVERLDAIVHETVIKKLDHKNLNVDVPQFAQLNSSVENIARVIHDMLKNEVKILGVELDQVSVWETSKTVCTYRG